MRIFIPSYNRPFQSTTPVLLDSCGVEYTLVLRNPAQAKLYLENPAFQRIRNRVAVLAEDGSVNVARESCRDVLEYGEWCLQMDDNIRCFTAAEPDFYPGALRALIID